MGRSGQVLRRAVGAVRRTGLEFHRDVQLVVRTTYTCSWTIFQPYREYANESTRLKSMLLKFCTPSMTLLVLLLLECADVAASRAARARVVFDDEVMSSPE